MYTAGNASSVTIWKYTVPCLLLQYWQAAFGWRWEIWFDDGVSKTLMDSGTEIDKTSACYAAERAYGRFDWITKSMLNNSEANNQHTPRGDGGQEAR